MISEIVLLLRDKEAARESGQQLESPTSALSAISKPLFVDYVAQEDLEQEQAAWEQSIECAKTDFSTSTHLESAAAYPPRVKHTVNPDGIETYMARMTGTFDEFHV